MDKTEDLRLDILHDAPIGMWSFRDIDELVIIDSKTKEKLDTARYYVTITHKGSHRLTVEVTQP